MINYFLKLFLAHLIADFILQPSQWISDKLKKSYLSFYLYLHIITHFIITSIILFFNDWHSVLIISISHLIIDILKIELTNKTHFNKRLLFFADQILHIIVLWIVCIHKFSIDTSQIVYFFLSNRALLLLVCLILVTQVSSVIIKQLISYWEIDNADNGSLKNAGKYIGMLERLLVFGFVITQQISAIGFLIAAKSVFRYNDLSRATDRKLTEYILIGTLLSFTLAILVGVLYLKILPFT